MPNTPANHHNSGFFARLGRSLRNGLLQRSSEAYLSCLTGGEAYWDEVVQFQNTIQTGSAAILRDYYEQPSPSHAAEPSGEEH